MCMTKNPIDMENWLLHHHIHLGISRFYIRVEDTPELKKLFSLEKWKEKVHATHDSGDRNYFSQMERQNKHVISSLDQAKLDGCTHLIHIDDDELLFAKNGVAAFEKFVCENPAAWFKIHNYEAVYSSEDCKHPFLSTNMFLTNPPEFTAYVNGKSMANVSAKIRPHGPHHFKGGDMTEFPQNTLVVLHYESPCIRTWKEKFKIYAEKNSSKCENGEIPFEYYCMSMESPTEEMWKKYKLYDQKKKIVRLSPFCSKENWPSYGRIEILPKRPIRILKVRPNTGLDMDMSVLSHFLKNSSVDCRHERYWNISNLPHWIIFLEHIPSDRLATRTIFMPNQELTENSDLQNLRYVDEVWCRSKYSASIFEYIKRKYQYKYEIRNASPFPCPYSFTAELKPRKLMFFHPAGQSWMKNTRALLDIWSHHEEWPLIVVACNKMCEHDEFYNGKCTEMKKQGANIRFSSFLSETDMNRIKNETKYTILPSACEGFGWSLREAIQHGSVVISTNAPPMNEYLTNERNALLIDAVPHKVGQGFFVNNNSIYSEIGQCGSECFELNTSSFEKVIHRAISMSDSKYVALKDQANRDFEGYNRDGQSILTSLCNQLD